MLNVKTPPRVTHTCQDLISHSIRVPPRINRMQSLLLESAEIEHARIQETSLGASGCKSAVDISVKEINVLANRL